MPSFSDLRPFSLEIMPGIFQISSQYANAFLIMDKDLTLVDTGFNSSIPLVLKVMREKGRSIGELKLVVITHNHLDHVGGLKRLRSLAQFKVAMHRADLTADISSLYPRGSIFGSLLRMPFLAPLRKRLTVDKSQIDVVLAGNESFDVLGGMNVLSTPGHTPGSISLYFPARKLLIAGDAVGYRGGELQLPRKSVSVDMRLAAESIRALSKLDIEILCKGHGSPVTRNVPARLLSLVSSYSR